MRRHKNYNGSQGLWYRLVKNIGRTKMLGARDYNNWWNHGILSYWWHVPPKSTPMSRGCNQTHLEPNQQLSIHWVHLIALFSVHRLWTGDHAVPIVWSDDAVISISSIIIIRIKGLFQLICLGLLDSRVSPIPLKWVSLQVLCEYLAS